MSSSPFRVKWGSKYDAVVIGSGPNGLSAAIELLRAQLSVLVIEQHSTPGGGARSEAVTLPGFIHDACSAVHPLAVASPLFRSLELQQHGLRWVPSPAPLAHVLEDGSAVMLERSIEATAEGLGIDGHAYRELLLPFVERFESLVPMLLGPLRYPSEPLLYARFGILALQSIAGLATRRFRGDAAPALLGGIAAHSMLRLTSAATSAFALVLGAAAHRVGWPIAEGGSQAVTNALVGCLRAHGGELATDWPIRSLEELPPAHAYLFDVSPQQLAEIAADRLPSDYRRRLERFKHGPGVYKMDWALSEPIPWKDPNCSRACTVHLSGDFAQLRSTLASVHAGTVSPRPFMLMTQPSLFDATRAPTGKHVAWAYCHVPNGSDEDLSESMEAHIERCAPGFRDVILGRFARTAVGMQAYNPNYVGGDINGGRASLGQLFFRPVAKLDPYATPVPNLFICSASTPPGGGVHGMCGYWAARSVLANVFSR